MPAKNRFSAYPDDVAKQKLEVIRKHEQDKAGTKPDGTPIKINDTWILENLVDRYHEPIASGVTNRQRLGGVIEEMAAVRSDVAEIKQVIADKVGLDEAFKQAMMDNIAKITTTLDKLTKELKS